MKCEICGKNRPARHIHKALIHRKGFTGYITADPECIRIEFGKVHGVEDYQFTGKQARYYHKEFMDWLKQISGPAQKK